jgi:hypothetical protein
VIWGNLLHLGYNMWSDREMSAPWGPLTGEDLRWVCASPHLRFDSSLWDDLLVRMSKAGMNLLVLDLGEGVRYESHPEIAAQEAWSTAELREELARVRELGLEPIPKLNFSTAHDAWLGPYARRVSTPEYYQVCGELIAEVASLFDKPRFFHIGYDEETFEPQRPYAYIVVRQHELWWHDFHFFVDSVRRQGMRPWMWSDYAWGHAEEFWKRVPKDILQSNWYYDLEFDPAKAKEVQTYLDLDRHGYEQVPTASNWSTPGNFAATVSFCRKRLDAARLLGFLQTPWKPTVERFREHHVQAIEVVRQVIAGLKNAGGECVDGLGPRA